MNLRGAGSVLANDALAGWTAIGLIGVTTVLGGGGASALPHLDAICQFAGFIALALMIVSGGAWRLDKGAWPWLILALAAFALPVLQLVPLPAAVVLEMPGRALANDIRMNTGTVPQRLPMTLDPDATITAALCMVPGIAAFVATLRCSQTWRRRLIVTWLVLAMIALVIGGVQVASGGTMAEIYQTPHRLAATGFFANRNHHSLFMLLGLLLAAALAFPPNRDRSATLEVIRLALLLALAAGILIASSRAGLILLAVSLPVLAVLVRGRRVLRISRSIAGGGAVALAALAAFLFFNPVARRVVDRFGSFDDARMTFWPDVIYTARQFWPVGSGLGTFPAVYLTQERLNSIDEYRVNHAHNDFLELLIEGGAPAAALMAVFLVLLVWRFATVRKLGGSLPRFALTAGFGILLVLGHSLVDYPLRAITLTVMFGFLAGLMFRPAQQRITETAA